MSIMITNIIRFVLLIGVQKFILLVTAFSRTIPDSYSKKISNCFQYKSSFSLSSHDTSEPISVQNMQRNMISRTASKCAAIVGIFSSKCVVAAESNCPCEFCQTGNICGISSAEAASEAWYNPLNARIFDTSKQSYLPPHADLYLHKAIQDKRIVCVGEVHSNPCHHKLEFDVVKSLSLMVPSENLAIGLECFYRQHQIALDRYVFKHQDFSLLKRETNWDYTWGFDINYYAKIFHYAAVHRIRLIGLNVPMGVTKLVVKTGLENLPASLKRFLPDVDLSDKRHRDQFLSTMRNAGHLPSDPLALDRMYEAQTLWDEYMAETASNYIRHSSPNAILCVIAGLGHIAGRSGIPNRIHKRTARDSFVIIPQQVEWFPDTGLPNVVSPPSISDCDWAWFTQREISYS